MSITQRERERERESGESSWRGGWRMQVTEGNCYHYLACSLLRRWRLLVGGAPFGPTMRETRLAIPSTLVSIDDRHFVESANSISLEHAWHFIANRTEEVGKVSSDLRPPFWPFFEGERLKSFSTNNCKNSYHHLRYESSILLTKFNFLNFFLSISIHSNHSCILQTHVRKRCTEKRKNKRYLLEREVNQKLNVRFHQNNDDQKSTAIIEIEIVYIIETRGEANY